MQDPKVLLIQICWNQEEESICCNLNSIRYQLGSLFRIRVGRKVWWELISPDGFFAVLGMGLVLLTRVTLLSGACGRGLLILKNLSCRTCGVSRIELILSCHRISEKDSRFISNLFCAPSTLVLADSSWRCFLLFFRDTVCSRFRLLFGIGSFLPFCLLSCFSMNFFSNCWRWLLWNGQILFRSQPGSHFLLILIRCL